jgi:putative membrane protein
VAGPGSWARAGAGERVAFIAGVITLWISLDWPLGPIAAGYLASAHALQFLIVTMFAAPLLLLGSRTGFIERIAAGAPSAGLRAVGRTIVHPLVAAIIFNAIVAASHVPSVVDGLMPTPFGAFMIDAAWLAGGLIFWWPVIMPAPVYARFAEPMKILYLLVGTLFHTVIVSTVGLIEPIQMNLPRSKRMTSRPAACMAGKLLAIMPMFVPSLGATSAR